VPPDIDGGQDIGDLFDHLEDLEDLVDSHEEREQVREAMQAATESQEQAVFGQVVWGFDTADLSEAVLGSLLFGIPMAVEGGTLDAGYHISQHPLYMLATLSSAVLMVIAILYVADIQDVRVRDPIFGLIPRRLVGVTMTPFVVAVALLTGWGMVTWTNPAVMSTWEAFCICCVAFVPMSIGAALGDILPGS